MAITKPILYFTQNNTNTLFCKKSSTRIYSWNNSHYFRFSSKGWFQKKSFVWGCHLRTKTWAAQSCSILSLMLMVTWDSLCILANYFIIFSRRFTGSGRTVILRSRTLKPFDLVTRKSAELRVTWEGIPFEIWKPIRLLLRGTRPRWQVAASARGVCYCSSAGPWHLAATFKVY